VKSKNTCMAVVDSDFTHNYTKMIGEIRGLVLSSQNVNTALSLAKVYGDLRWLNHDGVYDDDGLELALFNSILKVCKDELSQCEGALVENETTRNMRTVLLASKLYNQGGHTEVVIKWLNMMSDMFEHTLIVTDLIMNDIKDDIDRLGVRLVLCRELGVKAIKEILLAAVGSRYVIMHIHPNDIVAAMAARLLRSIGCICVFYNHADHVFSYGIGAANVVCEISSFGEDISRKSGRVRGDSFFLGVPLSRLNNECNHVAQSLNRQRKMILSCGAGYKYKPNGGAFFGEFVNEILSLRDDVVVVVVGSTGDESWWKSWLINGGNRWGGRVEFMGVLARPKYAELLCSADIYVDSFPITGGTAFPEALISGKLCAAMESPIQGYSCADELRAATVGELALQVNGLLHPNSPQFKKLERVRNKVISIQSEDVFKSKILDIYNQNFFLVHNNNITSKKHCTSWFETNWVFEELIHLPQGQSISQVPFKWRVKIIILTLRVVSNCGLKDLARFMYKSFRLPTSWVSWVK